MKIGKKKMVKSFSILVCLIFLSGCTDSRLDQCIKACSSQNKYIESFSNVKGQVAYCKCGKIKECK